MHVGQLFFDTSLVTQVETLHPYNTNKQPLILMEEDAVLIHEATNSDPLVQYVLLGDSVSDGVFAWITLGLDPDVNLEVKSSATWYSGFGKQWQKLWY